MIDDMKASISSEQNSLRVETRLPYFVVMSDDELSTDIVIIPLKEGYTFFGRDDCDPKPDVLVFGEGIDEKQCYINHKVELDPFDNHSQRICADSLMIIL